MEISVQNGRKMSLARNIIFLFFFCVTWAHGQVDLESNDLNEGDNGVKMFNNNNNNILLSLLKNDLRDGKRVRVQLYYESLGFSSMYFYLDSFMPVLRQFSEYLDIQTYPFGNSKVIEDNGKVEFECAHGPDECYGNKLHACAFEMVGYYYYYNIVLQFNACLMSRANRNSAGSDDEAADQCGHLMNIDTRDIKNLKDCAKGNRGTELLLYYGEQSKKANFSYVPHLLINGQMSDASVPIHFKDDICAALNLKIPYCVD